MLEKQETARVELGELLFRDRQLSGKANCTVCHHGLNLTDNDFHKIGIVSDDVGRRRASFKTPGLRNVALTAPYFHNASEKTLEDVVRFYNKGGKNSDKRGLARGIKPLKLSENEINALVAFLETLTSPVHFGNLKIKTLNKGGDYRDW